MSTDRKCQLLPGAQDAQDESRQDYARGPFESVQAWAGRIRRQAAKDAAACGMRLMKEGGSQQSDQELRKTATQIIEMAAIKQRGAWSHLILSVYPPVTVTVDYDGEGGVWINEDAFLTNAGCRFAHILHTLGNGRIHDGVLEGCEPTTFIFGLE